MSTQIEPVLTVTDLDLMPDDGNRYEIIEGELFVSRAPGLKHQLVVKNFIASIQNHLDNNPIGIVVPGPGIVFSELTAVIPDVVFISNARREEIASGERLTGAPDIVIEVLSPGSENDRRDRIVKRHLYGKYGVKEYWIADPENRATEIYLLADTTMKLVRIIHEGDEITSSVLQRYRCKVRKIFWV